MKYRARAGNEKGHTNNQNEMQTNNDSRFAQLVHDSSFASLFRSRLLQQSNDLCECTVCDLTV